MISAREKKVATYKLALLRALTDIAMTEGHRVRFRKDGRVAVPFEAISERWVVYYWPLFSAPRFLPQQSGEAGRQKHLLAFSDPLRPVYDSPIPPR